MPGVRYDLKGASERNKSAESIQYHIWRDRWRPASFLIFYPIQVQARVSIIYPFDFGIRWSMCELKKKFLHVEGYNHASATVVTVNHQVFNE